MPRYLVERHIPGIGELSPDALTSIARKVCAVIDAMGPQIQWVRSYVTQDALTCEYVAPNAECIGEHARRGDFPVTQVREIGSVIELGNREVRVESLHSHP